MRRVGTSWWVPLLAVVALVGSVTWMVVQGQGVGAWGSTARVGMSGSGYGSMGGSMNGSMMGGSMWGAAVTGGGPVEDLGSARTAAEEFADDLSPGLGVAEVMRFDNQYYAEIVDADGALVTEALVDPSTGAVQIECGPARMWNTRFGMMAGSAASGGITASEAEEIARRWLADESDLTTGEAELFPGYFTLHTLRDGAVQGMLSVNSTTGEVWYHSWHGEFVEMTEAP